MKEPQKEFEGNGEMKGWSFSYVQSTPKVYLYKLRWLLTGICYWEVFKRKENVRFDIVSYPKGKSFGKWAWCFRDYEDAIKKYNEINNKETLKSTSHETDGMG